MKPKKEALDQYREMSKASPGSITAKIREHLQANCPKFDEAHFTGCLSYLYETVLELLGGRKAAVDNRLAGEVPDDVCYKICRDYFDDELWREQPETEKAEEPKTPTSTIEKKVAEKVKKIQKPQDFDALFAGVWG